MVKESGRDRMMAGECEKEREGLSEEAGGTEKERGELS